MNDYSIKRLHETFLDHAAKSEKSDEDFKKRFIEDYPGEPLPEHMNYNFNLPRALAAMCAAIISLQSE